MSPTTEVPSGLELLRAAARLPAAEHGIGGLLGMRIDEVNEGEVTFSLDTRTDFANPLGSVHGGICATLLDSVMGCAVHTTLGPGIGYGTLELKVNYVRTVPTDGVRLTATGRVIHAGRQVATAEGRVEDERGRLVAHGTTTCLIYPATTP
ncbi:PaaI family thioesterase [Tsukamurella tyrosinosolvens]|uniref:Acyl-CoA thioesterase n=1 Tax=Tsukamurella tyrosinosolvens TaxID=57704 RepID=A0A1H4YLE5_TSUTY|nr:PaaI family thioesterase [Tsukamurella tyrosinosolvens]KXP00388.1 thioesterase [Tsukamurella tyrosinosolvens]KXP04783.1 thioesterase [Tsukamurella tyrosinosolvens]KZL98037.1 thioesterase [Tsukamurella tyrosinosolvens]MCA4995317.1 PaaI family thioesterase [Tsukamurella tyrosinosolvens]MEC4611715.1 PaaI family thioesterase [Tsukamurella tyrosinosolvens]